MTETMLLSLIAEIIEDPDIVEAYPELKAIRRTEQAAELGYLGCDGQIVVTLDNGEALILEATRTR